MGRLVPLLANLPWSQKLAHNSWAYHWPRHDWFRQFNKKIYNKLLSLCQKGAASTYINQSSQLQWLGSLQIPFGRVWMLLQAKTTLPPQVNRKYPPRSWDQHVPSRWQIWTYLWPNGPQQSNNTPNWRKKNRLVPRFRHRKSLRLCTPRALTSY